MVKGFLKLFVKSEDYADPSVREKVGSLSGIMGIVLNILMSAAKIVSGIFTGAISILSDGINNLSDAGSSVITLLGFKLAAKKPDRDHPYGHGRIEYFAGLAVSIVIIVVAVQLFIESLGKVINGEVLSFESDIVFWITVVILSVSILIKCWMALFNRKAGKLIASVAMEATALDSISDCISTSVVLASAVIIRFVPEIPFDGYAGIIVSLFIAYTGVRSVLEVMNDLLGKKPDRELVNSVAEFVKNYDRRIVGIHDLMFHDYGPGRQYLILHVEVPANENILELHDLIDNIESALEEKFNCFTTIHMDPVVTDNARVTELKELVIRAVGEIDPLFTVHDFRMNEGPSHANLIFDVVITRETKLSEQEISSEIDRKIKEYDTKLNTVVKIEYSFV